jgi:hypothetical protein
LHPLPQKKNCTRHPTLRVRTIALESDRLIQKSLEMETIPGGYADYQNWSLTRVRSLVNYAVAQIEAALKKQLPSKRKADAAEHKGRGGPRQSLNARYCTFTTLRLLGGAGRDEVEDA